MPESKVLIPLDKDGIARWRGEISRAQNVRTQISKWWDANLKKYAPAPNDDPDAYGSNVNTNRDFTLVERKKPDLFFRQPDVSCKPSPLFAGQEHLLTTHAQILNEKLGDDGANAVAMAHKVLFDVLCPAGTGFSELGYEAVTQDVSLGAQPGAVLNLSQPVPVPVFERCYWEHFSPRRALIPQDFRSTDWDKAPWLGLEFEIPLRAAKRLWGLPADFRGARTADKIYFDYGLQAQIGDDVVTGQRIWYQSAVFRDDVVHPQHYTLLVFVDGLDEPVEHRDSPHQDFDARGRLSPTSLIGNPIHPLTIRVLTDSAYVPSDCTVSRPLVNELNRYREQGVEFRDAAIMRWQYNTDTLPPEALSKIVRSPIGGMIGVPGEAFVGEGAIKELPQGSIPRENFEMSDRIDNDLERTHAMPVIAQGASTGDNQTATHDQLVQGNANARLSFEQLITLGWYVRGVSKFSTLTQRYLPVAQAAAIVGPEKAAEWDAWRKQVPASLAFTALPNAALRSDAAVEAKQAQEDYTFLVNDPHVNKFELLKMYCQRRNYDITKLLVPQLPEKQPEPAKASVAFKVEDFVGPGGAVAVELAAQCGLKVSPEALMKAQTLGAMMAFAEADAKANEANPQEQHGGKQPQAESLDKHHADLTGGMQGSGEITPMGAGGMVQ